WTSPWICGWDYNHWLRSVVRPTIKKNYQHSWLRSEWDYDLSSTTGYGRWFRPIMKKITNTPVDESMDLWMGLQPLVTDEFILFGWDDDPRLITGYGQWFCPTIKEPSTLLVAAPAVITV
ncbi:11874_t:CDS:2, partial [Acaulospora morrowiae]